MADDNPVTAPAEAEKPENTSADRPDEASETVATSDQKTTEPAHATDDKKEAEAENKESAASGDVTESKNDGESAAAPADAEAAAPETNGSAPAKKSAKDRRRSSGVGEKSKQLSRKKSQIRTTQLNAKPGEYYLARLRSYAPWPSIICDEEILPNTLLDNRPVTAMQKDGTYRADYADDGKRAHERTFPVMFFGTNEFAWDVSEKNKAKGLIAAYKIAAEGHDLQYFKSLLADHQAALQQEIDEAEAEENAKAAAKAEKAKKTKRKSKGADTDVDMEDADEKKPKSSKKRKNETEAEAEKPAKTPKTSTKLKLTTPKAPAEESSKKTPASKTKKAPAKKGKAAAKDEEDIAEAKEPEKQIDPEELKKKKEKEVLFLRHKLQKGFISRDQPPKEDEMATMGTYFDKLEKHADLEVSIIRSTKINKVLKMIVKLNSIPRDEEFNFRHRAMNILSSWKAVLDSDTPAGDKDFKPTANGSSKEDEGADTPKLETEEEKEPESKAGNDDTPMPDADADKPEETEKHEATQGDKPAEEKAVETSA
ncbi:uncharacterized protein N7498_000361 [Penicillium cinerascens]|uniref:PWWP domain-containing protein n=1 Tax=Penicillium cinerascens TaxID=70096 RepID=A0A9W9NE75_9EURO|nr:uncharacterized protein N7498_000361 [Penicillium cinerascens]KAJ5218262.1 hypothetical protein N7498_000361 [Penicillium cinerascens]